MTIPVLTTSWCSISRTVLTNAFVNHGGFPLQAAIHWSRCSIRTPAVRYTVCWLPLTSIRIHSHPTACCCLFLLFPVVRTIFQSASWVMFLVAALAASPQPNCCLRSCFVPVIAVFDVAPANRLDLDLLSPCWGGRVSMTVWNRRGRW